MNKHAKFAAKIADQIGSYAVSHDPRAFTVDPGKLGRLASSAPLAAKYAACKAMNVAIQKTGTLTEADVKTAFEAAGLN